MTQQHKRTRLSIDVDAPTPSRAGGVFDPPTLWLRVPETDIYRPN